MKKTFTFIYLLMVNICTFSQAISLEVDCQNPGWLSNKIAYGDQKTIQNLKLTGYINADDLAFIGEMVSKQSLRGCIDLEDVNIVGKTTSEDNVMPENAFNIQWNADNPEGIQISEIIFPLSLIKSINCLSSELFVDKITIGGESMPIVKGDDIYDNVYSGGDGVRFNKRVKHLILREGVTEIPESAFYNKPYNSYGTPKEECRFESVTFPSTINKIGRNAFVCSYNLTNINSIDSITDLGEWAFYKTNVYKEKVVVPAKLTKFYFNSFNIAKEYYLGDNIELIDNHSDNKSWGANGYYYNSLFYGNEMIIHIATDAPPKMSYGGEGGTSDQFLKNATIYVPKSSVSKYQNANVWKYATILPDPIPATSIEIDLDSVELVKGKTKQLSATVLPTDADSIYYSWSSSNSEIVSVSSTGLITANSSGEAFVIATLNADSTIIDSCKVKVIQPVTSVVLNTKEKTLNVGETYTLYVTVNPNDADNKNIIWTSENPEIASIENGTIKALKAGIVKITATSEDNNNATDYCEVIVNQPTIGISLNYSEYTIEGIGETIQLEALVFPEDATNKNVNWKSLNENVCIVSNGKVVAVGYGTSVIIAITVDGGHMATCTIVVNESTDIVDKYVSLTDGEDYTNATEQEADRITYTRKFNNTQWQAWYVPFDIDYDAISDDFTAASLNAVHQYDDDEDGVFERWTLEILKLKSGEVLRANMPYMIRAKGTGEHNFVVENAILYPAEENSLDCSSVRVNYTFKGNYSLMDGQVLRDNGWFAPGGGSLVTPTVGSNLKAYRWLLMPEARIGYGTFYAPKRINIVIGDEEGEVTGIEEVTQEEWPADVYDLNGRMVKAQAENLDELPKGVYIVNGKKFVK